MTHEQLLQLSESLMTWLMQDRLALGLVSASLVLVMLALALRWSLRKPMADASRAAAAAPVVLPSGHQERVASTVPDVPAEVPASDSWPVRVEQLADEVSALRARLADTEALLRRQADKLACLERQLAQPISPVASDTDDDARQAGYEQAMMLAAHGVPVRELMAKCGLTRPEAQLIVLLHGRGGQA